MPRVVIIGGGIAGLATGIAFQNAKWDVQVLERAERIEPMGAALSIWPNACAALQTLGVLEAVAHAGAPIRSMMLAEKDGRELLRRDIDRPAFMVTRTALQNALANQLQDGVLKLNCSVERIHARSIYLTNGSSIEPDLIIDAGGIRSVSNGVVNPKYAGYGGVLALTPAVTGPQLNGLAAEYWGKDERFGVFELAGEMRYWFYMRTQPVDAQMPTLSQCIELASDWPQDVRTAVQSTSEDALIPFAVHSNPAPRRLGDEMVIRVGDAAHAMEPNQGQGACQGLEDAAALAVLAAKWGPAELYDRFETLRLKRARMFVKESSRARLGVHGPNVLQQLFRVSLRKLPRSLFERVFTGMQTMPNYGAHLGE